MRIPDGCELIAGSAPVLLIAPHGGRRPILQLETLPPNLRVNDLYTADLTRELAQRLDATAIINYGIDRNYLDLNRVSQLRRSAPWLIALLARECARLCERHSRVNVVFVHGWNTGQAKCDVGVGAVGDIGDFTVCDGSALTLSPASLERLVNGLRASGTAEVSVGARYPASHSNNAVQLFRSRRDAASPAEVEIAELAKLGRAQAVQLELGVPLRWPGPWRDDFLVALTRTLDQLVGQSPTPVVWRPSVRLLPTKAVSLQVYDEASGIGLMTGVGPIGDGFGGRLLLWLGGNRVALFTGEESSPAPVLPLALEASDGRLRLHFDGPVLLLEDANLYLDLENAMASSRVVRATVEAEFCRSASSSAWRGLGYGQFIGKLNIDGRKREMGASAIGGSVPLRMGGSFVRTAITAVFGPGEFLAARAAGDDGVAAEWIRNGSADAIESSTLSVETDPDHSPQSMIWQSELDGGMRLTPLTRMPIVRGLGKSSYLRVTFGIARAEWQGRRGHAFYEHSVPLGG